MTETEAKTKWCPIGFLAVMNVRDGAKVSGDGLCIGSACMMWKELPMSYSMDEEFEAAPDVAHGYCGLAGKP